MVEGVLLDPYFLLKCGIKTSLSLAYMITSYTDIYFSMLRDTIPPKILINLCTALIALKLLFLIGAEATSSKVGCKSVAILLHYFFVAVFTWSGVEGFHSARGLVFPMKVEITMFMQKALVFGWGKYITLKLLIPPTPNPTTLGIIFRYLSIRNPVILKLKFLTLW